VGTQHSASATRLYADQRTLAAPRPPSAPTRAWVAAEPRRRAAPAEAPL